jgi:hypothetical protein
MGQQSFWTWRWSVVLLVLAGCGTSQIGPDPQAFKAVDALYTAVSLREPARVESCQAKLRALHEAGKLPNAAYKDIESIVEEARGGSWDSAITKLARFLEGQHR